MILNLTQHKSTPDQISAGVVDFPEHKRMVLVKLLTVNDLPTHAEVLRRCSDISLLAVWHGAFTSAMIGGAPAMMRPLEDALLAYNIQPLYAFSKRESVEIEQPDGSVIKENVFRHAGWWPHK